VEVIEDKTFSKKVAVGKDMLLKEKKREMMRGEVTCHVCIRSFHNYDMFVRHVKGTKYD
jgi:hypothetical protein